MKRTVASLAIFLATSSAYALEMDGEMYLVGTVGKSIMIHSPMQIDNNNIVSGSVNNLAALNSTQESDKHGFKLQLGYQLTPNFAIEGGYVNLGKTRYSANYTSQASITLPAWLFPTWLPAQIKNQIQQQLRGPASTGSASREAEISGWNLSGLGLYPINDKLSVFAKLGAIRSQIKTSDSGTAFGEGSVTEASWKGILGVGANYAIDENLGIRAEFERFNKLGDKETTGTMDVNLLSVGVTGKF